MTGRILSAPRFNEGWIPAFAGMTAGTPHPGPLPRERVSDAGMTDPKRRPAVISLATSFQPDRLNAGSRVATAVRCWPVPTIATGMPVISSMVRTYRWAFGGSAS